MIASNIMCTDCIFWVQTCKIADTVLSFNVPTYQYTYGWSQSKFACLLLPKTFGFH